MAAMSVCQCGGQVEGYCGGGALNKQSEIIPDLPFAPAGQLTVTLKNCCPSLDTAGMSLKSQRDEGGRQQQRLMRGLHNKSKTNRFFFTLRRRIPIK